MSAIEFLSRGVSKVLDEYALRVPVNQRSYKWEEEHVADLFSDIQQAMEDSDSEYFLGTMVFTKNDTFFEVADGQQRLATTMVLLSAIRDRLLEYQDQDELVKHIEDRFLRTYSIEKDSIETKLTLNAVDREYFTHAIILSPTDQKRKATVPKKPSHHRIAKAAQLAKTLVNQVLASRKPEHQIACLKSWITFLRDKATVVLVVVPDKSKAFTIFETLNDRGLKLSQVDLLKNYLYGLAGAEKIGVVERDWECMIGILEAGEIEDEALDFIRQQFISYSGYVKNPDLYDKIKEKVKTPARAVEYANNLKDDATRYAALVNPAHPHWEGDYGEEARKAIEVLTRHLKAKRILSLLLAIDRKFEPKHVGKAFRLCVSWSVRFLITGGIGSGTVEKFYADTAALIQSGEIDTPKSLAEAMSRKVPSDEEFENAFAQARVSKSNFARYYLRAVENESRHGQHDAMLVPVEDVNKADLEHVIPEHPCAEWSLDADLMGRLYNRIGNLALMAKADNSLIKNWTFNVKKPYYERCPYKTTKMIAGSGTWGEAEIDARQRRLAKLAVNAWSLKP